MKHKYIIIILISLLILDLNPVFGQEFMALTLEQCLEIGLKNNRTLQISSQNVELSRAQYGEVRANLLPAFKFNANYARLSDIPPFAVTIPFAPPTNNEIIISQPILNTYGLRLNLQQPIFTGFRLKSSVEVARFNLAASTVGYQQQRMELVYEIKKAYWQLYLTREMVVVLTENVKAVETHLKDARNFFRQGLITQEDVLRTEARLSNSELQLSETQNRVKMAELNLNHILGLPLDAQIQLNSRLNPDETEIAALDPKAVDLALERRPEIQAAEFRLRAAQSSLTLAKSGYFPQLFLNGNYNYDRPNQRILPAEDKFRDTWDLSLALSFELWNWGKTANLKQQAEARLKQSQQTMNNLKDLITLEINQSYLNLDQAHQALALTEKIVQQSEENHRMVQNKFKLGVASNSELLDAEVELLQAKIGYTNALVDFKLAEAWWAKSLSQD